MSPYETLAACNEAIKDGSRLTLVRQKGATLPGFPRGELLCENHNGNRVVSYAPETVIAWLEKNNLINDNGDLNETI